MFRIKRIIFKKIDILLTKQILIFQYSIQKNSMNTIRSVNELVNSTPLLRQYFSKHAKRQEDYPTLAIQLLFESISRRNQMRSPQPQTVQLKHKAFVSPKKDITPKVTEVHPFSPHQHIIHSKPKRNVETGNGCVLHSKQECQNTLKCSNLRRNENSKQTKQSKSNKKKQTYYEQKKQNIFKESKPLDPLKSQLTNLEQETIYLQPIYKPAESIKRIKSPPLPTKTISKQSSRPKIQKVQSKSPRLRYDQVQSKIKGLVCRDKLAKKLQQKMKQHAKILKQIQQKQCNARSNYRELLNNQISSSVRDQIKSRTMYAQHKKPSKYQRRSTEKSVSDCSGCSQCDESEESNFIN